MGGDGPPRGGTRGGRDQFDWEAVKSDKDREFYLGASVKASVGRWQKGRDILWYTRDKDGGAGGVAAEVAAVKAEEERLMQEALGLRPVAERRGGTALDAAEMKELLKRTAPEPAGAPAGDDAAEATRVKGVGYSALALEQPESTLHETLAGVGVAMQAQDAARGRQAQAGYAAGGGAGGAAAPAPAQKRRHGSPSSSSSSGSRREGRAERKARKKAKKEAKREKKDAKRARKDHERRRD